MRELIQPALKVTARTGLFLSVVAWVVGQWWYLDCTVSRFGNSVFVQLDCKAWFIFGSATSSRAIEFEVKEPKDIPDDGFFASVGFASPLGAEVLVTATDWWQFAGIGYASLPWGSGRVSIRHYLIVSTFTIFNVALWWYYRKSKEVTPCES